MNRAVGLTAILLLSTSCGKHPIPDSATTTAPNISFRDVAAETGVRFQHRNGAAGEFHMPEIMGAGVALFDMDGDGDLDIYMVQSDGPGQLFRNDLQPIGKLAFADVTAGSGITYKGYGMGAATGDVDNDGDLDLLITGYGSRALYRNEGAGHFAEIPLPPQPVANLWSTSASFFDYDRDNKLDLVILSYVNFSRQNNKKCQAPTGEADYCTPKAYTPMSARLYHNEGDGKFIDATVKAGIDRALGPGLGVAAADLNADGWPDLFVANDTAANHVWINQRNGTFKESGLECGAAYSEDGLAKAGMGVAVADFDQDGDEDLFVVNLMREGATLFRNDGIGQGTGLPNFLDISKQSAIFAATFNFTGFGAGWLDADNDGILDLFTANGAVTLREEQRGQPAPFKERNLLLRGDGKGKFADVSEQAGSVFGLEEVTRGAAFGDLDNDGDIDIVISNNAGPARLLLNESAPANWMQVRLLAPVTAGATVTLHRAAHPPLTRRSHSDSSYGSASDPRVHFGLGKSANALESIEIRWPDGTGEKWIGIRRNTTIDLKKGTGTALSYH